MLLIIGKTAYIEREIIVYNILFYSNLKMGNQIERANSFATISSEGMDKLAPSPAKRPERKQTMDANFYPFFTHQMDHYVEAKDIEERTTRPRFLSDVE